MVDLLSLAPDAARAALTQWLAERGEPAYRTRQVLPRLWKRPVASWDDATELPALLRGALDVALPLRRLRLSAGQGSEGGPEEDIGDLGGGEGGGGGGSPRGGRGTPCLPA